MRLFLAMIIITTIEVILIAKVGKAIGFPATFIVIVATAMLGSWKLRKQWAFVIGKLQNLQSEPSQALLEALILLISGVLLITPGFLTDIVGFLGLIPVIRERFVSLIRRHAGGLIRGGFTMQRGRFETSAFERPVNPSTDDIIEGEFERKED
ncbi:MAG: biotin--acetyl-CoA-carboxylase ligase [Gammaproteobacteria bacterium]|nr:MAG: biotin--acetyl-CoA-carboxylase ligase [Gammaproteobacteria bacterium]